MVTLFQRIISNDENNDKIGIHMVQSLMSEIGAGRITPVQAAEIMGITIEQTTDYVNVLTAALQSSNPVKFSARIFNYLFLAENARRAVNDGLDGYLLESNFWAMVSVEAAK